MNPLIPIYFIWLAFSVLCTRDAVQAKREPANQTVAQEVP